MNARLYYFSATGNTARAAQIIARRLEQAGHAVTLQPVNSQTPPPQEVPDLTLIAFPVWSWAAPHFILTFVKHLPKTHNARATVFATCGAFGAQAVDEAERLLKRRGYRVEADGEAPYPDNWILAMNPPTGAALEESLARGDQAAAAFADRLAENRSVIQHCAFGHKLWSWPVSQLFRSFGRRYLGKLFLADDSCTSCGRCAQECPVQAIRLEGMPPHPRWTAGCAGCYRCINLCPVQAIQISLPLMLFHLGLSLFLTIAGLGSIGWIHRQLPACPAGLSWVAATAAAIAGMGLLTLLQLTIVDGALQRLTRYPALKSLFQTSYTRGFGRYQAPGFRPGRPAGP